jgi:hypothetical protein
MTTMKTATTIQTATTFHSDFFNTDCLIVDGQPYFSVTGATKVLYGAIGGTSVKRLMAALAKVSSVPTPSSATDLSDFPGICPVLVERSGTGSVIAHAMDVDTFGDLLDAYAQKNTKAGRYARATILKMAKANVELKLKSEAGLVHEETTREIDSTLAKYFKDTPGNEPADPVTKLKAPLIANGQKDGCKSMGILVNEFVYNRLPVKAYDEMIKKCGGHRRVAFKTNWQTLSTAAQERLEYIIQIALAFIEVETADGPVFNWAPVIQKLDLLLPRHRTSGYCPILTNK